MSKQNQSNTPGKTKQGDKSRDITPAADALTPESAEAVPETKDTGKPAPRKKRNKPHEHHYLAKLALLCSLIIAAGVFTLWQHHTSVIHTLSQQLELQQKQLNNELQTQSNSVSAIQANNQTLQTEIRLLAQDQKQLSQAFSDLLKSNRHLKQDWLISEAEYLVNLAGQRLGLMRDVKTAITALKAADSRLRETGNPELIAIREALAKDINQLEAVHQADLTGLSLKLSAMLTDIDQLKLLTSKPDDAILKEQKKESTEVKDWKALPAAMWHDIKKLIVIREHQGPIKPLLSPEQFFFLSQNLKLQLEQARLAMLNAEPQIYVERITTAKAWVKKWFDSQDSKTRNFLNQLDELLAQNIHPQLPALQNSFAAFKQYHENINLPDSVKSELNKSVKKQPAPVKKAKPEKPVQQKPKSLKQQPEQNQNEQKSETTAPLPAKSVQVPL